MPEPKRLSTGTKWTALVVLMLVLLGLLVGAAEVVTRMRQAARHGTSARFDSLYRVDPAIGLRVLVPGAQVGRITVNSLGFRGPEIEAVKPPGRVRIAFLGASTTFCAEASGNDAVWPQVAIEQLRRRFPGVDFDFVNGGVPGYTAASSLKNLRHRVAPLQPDVVVVYHATNDLSLEARRLAEKQGLAAPKIEREPSWLAQNSRLWELVEKNLSVMVAMQGAETARGRVLLDDATMGADFRRRLSELVDAASQDGRRVAVATFSARLRPEQTPEEKKQAAVSALVYMPHMSLDGLLVGYARYNDLIRAVSRDKGALLIDGENLIPGDAVHFVDSVHFTDAGSRAMGERVASVLASDPGIQQLIAKRKADRG